MLLMLVVSSCFRRDWYAELFDWCQQYCHRNYIVVSTVVAKYCCICTTAIAVASSVKLANATLEPLPAIKRNAATSSNPGPKPKPLKPKANRTFEGLGRMLEICRGQKHLSYTVKRSRKGPGQLTAHAATGEGFRWLWVLFTACSTHPVADVDASSRRALDRESRDLN